MTLQKPWSHEAVLERLASHAIRPQKNADGSLSQLEASKDTHVGLKLWAYIGFLGVKLVRI